MLLEGLYRQKKNNSTTLDFFFFSRMKKTVLTFWFPAVLLCSVPLVSVLWLQHECVFLRERERWETISLSNSTESILSSFLQRHQVWCRYRLCGIEGGSCLEELSGRAFDSSTNLGEVLDS